MNRWRKFLQKIWILLTALFCLFGVTATTYAQNGFTLSVTPNYTEVPLGTNFVLEMIIEDGADLNAFDLIVVYDQDVLTLTDWDYGDYFTNLASMTVSNQPGSLRVAATQVASSPVSGDGTVLTMTFNAKGQGYSFIDITQAEFADSAGNKLEPEVVNGQVAVTLEPTYTPTVTSTSTRTSTPTRTSTLAPTVTATGTKTGTSTSTLIQTETAEVVYTQTPISAFTETPSGQTGTAVTRTATGTALAGTVDSRLTPTITRSPWPVLEASVTDLPQTSVTPMSVMDEPLPAQDQDQSSRNLLNGLLWGMLIVGVIILIVLTVLIIRRVTQEEEDLLL